MQHMAANTPEPVHGPAPLAKPEPVHGQLPWQNLNLCMASSPGKACFCNARAMLGSLKPGTCAQPAPQCLSFANPCSCINMVGPLSEPPPLCTTWAPTSATKEGDSANPRHLNANPAVTFQSCINNAYNLCGRYSPKQHSPSPSHADPVPSSN
jgi:hypothetical protein